MITTGELHWFKSSYSGGSASDCVEAAQASEGMFVRDSTRPTGPVLRFQADAFARFVSAVKASV
ncbi:DUF397 domain-containing protein [Streptomyces albiaxialis]|uniref:DUF397 domain-containing protein n=2 Tax=Streptomyces albiaxialis TaxID=329523 RepID=A0ABN2X851_9ACTN